MTWVLIAIVAALALVSVWPALRARFWPPAPKQPRIVDLQRLHVTFLMADGKEYQKVIEGHPYWAHYDDCYHRVTAKSRLEYLTTREMRFENTTYPAHSLVRFDITKREELLFDVNQPRIEGSE